MFLKPSKNSIEDVTNFGTYVKTSSLMVNMLYDYRGCSVTNDTNNGEIEDITEVDVDDLLSDSIFFKGWYGVENSNDVDFRWAKQTAYINLSGLEGYTFKFNISTSNPICSAIPVTVYFVNYVTKEKLGSITLSENANSKPIEINITDDTSVFMLYSDVGWVPALYLDDSDDWRELAVFVENVKLNKECE